MSVSIKVAVRCRPFTRDDKLGVNLIQSGEEDAVVELINSNYSTNQICVYVGVVHTAGSGD